MEKVDAKIVAAFLDLSNFFAEKNGFKIISSLDNLWKEHGELISNLMKIESNEINTSIDFYNSLFKKLKIISSSFAEGLDPKKAANGNLLEICKFYSLHLEFLRNMQPEMLKKVLEHLAIDKNFDSDALLHMFEVFDKLYEEDCADNWWSFMKVEEKYESVGMDSPIIIRQQSGFITPTASTRRVQNIVSSAKRSPIVEMVDSPTMRFVRAERELKQFNKKLIDVELKLEEAENENSMLLKENRQLKAQIADRKIKNENDRVDVEKAEKKIGKYSEELELKTLENERLTKELNEFRQMIRASQRQIETLDKEKNQMSEKINSLTKEKEEISKNMREVQESNEADYIKWQQTEQELKERIAELACSRSNLADELLAAKTNISELKIEIKSLKDSIEQKDLDLGWSKKNEEALEEEKNREIKNYEEWIKSLKRQKDQEIEREKAKRKMAEQQVEKLTSELQSNTDERNSLKNIILENQLKFDNQEQKIAELEKKNEEFEENTGKLMAEVAYLEGLVGGRKRMYSFSSTYSVFDAIDNGLKKDENIPPENRNNTLKPVAFTIDLDLKNEMPPGFKLNSSQKGSETSFNRYSISDEKLEREKLDKASVRSDCIQSGNNSNTKQPYEQTETDKERIRELKQRNEKVKPALKCSYATELFNVSSPSGNESNIKGTIQGKHRTSFTNMFGKK